MTLQRADTLLGLGRHQEALSVLAAMGDDGLSGRAQCLRARAFMGLERLQEADEAAAAAIVADPGNEWGYRLAAIVARKRRRTKEADQLAERAVVLAPNEPNTHQVAALTALDRRDKERALRHAETMTRLAPNNGLAHCTVARALIANGRVLEAEEPLRRALAIDPNDDEAMSLLADVIGKHDKAQAAQLRLAALRTAPQQAGHRRAVMRRGGLAVGGTALAVGKLGILGKLALLGGARAALSSQPAGDGLLLALLIGGYCLAFGVTRLRRRQHGKTLPPLVWEGLRADRRNADLMWLAVPAAFAVVIGIPSGLGQLAQSSPPVAFVGSLTGAVLLAVCWHARLGQARELRPRDVVSSVTSRFRLRR